MFFLFKIVILYFIFNYITTIGSISLDTIADFIAKAGECIVEIIINII